MSSLAYGCETWVLQDQQAKSHVHSSVMKLYRRLQGVAHCQHVSDEMILSQCEVPSPTEFLRRARLRYLGTLYRGASTADWGIVNSDLQWLLLLQDNCVWLWQQLQHCSSLEDPREHCAAWEYLLQFHPQYWKRLVNRGVKHSIQQRRNRYLVREMHRGIFTCLADEGNFALAEPTYEKQYQDTQVFGCMQCGLRCASRGGEGAHFFRKHAVVGIYVQRRSVSTF